MQQTIQPKVVVNVPKQSIVNEVIVGVLVLLILGIIKKYIRKDN